MKTTEKTMMEDLIKRIESKINATPTGDLRNLLTEINICIQTNQSKWISVKDELPKDYEMVIIATKCGHVFICFIHKNEWLITPDVYKITHWQPLPEPPKP